MDNIVTVEMLAFMEGEQRPVKLPEKPTGDVMGTLEKVYYYGQNEVQPIADRCSVSVGDVIHLGAEKYLVCPLGFYKLTEQEYLAHKALPRRDRCFNAYTLRDSMSRY